MKLVGTSLLSLFGFAVKIAALLGINKILAVYVGPEGYAVLGQFQNILSMLISVGSLGLSVGITKYTAQYFNQDKELNSVWTTAAICTGASSLSLVMIISFYSYEISYYLIRDQSYSWIIITTCIFLPFLTFNTILLAIFNGKKMVKSYVGGGVLNSFLSFIFVYIGVSQFGGLNGALIALVLGQAFSFFGVIFFTRNQRIIKRISFVYFDWKVAKNLAKYTVMAATTLILGPLIQIIVRNDVIEVLGLDSAGYWEAITRLGTVMILAVSTAISVYYLPRISELIDKKLLKREIIDIYKLFTPIILAGTVLLYFFRNELIVLIFSKDFLPIQELFKIQLVGDFFRIISWPLSFYLIAKAMTKSFIAIEVFFSLVYIIFAQRSIEEFGLIGLSITYTVNNIFYFIALFYCVYKRLSSQ